MKKQYIIKKYVMAENVKMALRNEQKIVAHEAWIDEDWKREHTQIADTKIGYKVKK